MRRLPLIAFLFAAALPAPAPAQGFDPKLEAVVRCYDAASVYAQFFVLTKKQAAVDKLNGYAAELKGRAYAIGAKDGRSHADVRAEFADNDADYVRRFYAIGAGGMIPTEFGVGEIAACNLDKVIR